MRTDIALFPNEPLPQLPDLATTELSLNDVAGGCAEFVHECGRVLPQCSKLIIRSISLVNLDFLAAFPPLHSLTVACSQLQDLEGLRAQTSLRTLYIGESLSSRGSLAPLADLQQLAELGLSGPHPGKHMQEVGALQELTYVSLYRPKWPIELLVTFAPNVRHLKILHCAAESLDFMLQLPHLQILEIAYFRKLTTINPALRRQLARLEVSHCPKLQAS